MQLYAAGALDCCSCERGVLLALLLIEGCNALLLGVLTLASGEACTIPTGLLDTDRGSCTEGDAVTGVRMRLASRGKLTTGTGDGAEATTASFSPTDTARKL